MKILDLYFRGNSFPSVVDSFFCEENSYPSPCFLLSLPYISDFVHFFFLNSILFSNLKAFVVDKNICKDLYILLAVLETIHFL